MPESGENPFSSDRRVESMDVPESGVGGELLYKAGAERHLPVMTTVTLEEAQICLPDLARRVEEGERVVVTRDGEPVLDMVPHPTRKGGLD